MEVKRISRTSISNSLEPLCIRCGFSPGMSLGDGRKSATYGMVWPFQQQLKSKQVPGFDAPIDADSTACVIIVAESESGRPSDCAQREESRIALTRSFTSNHGGRMSIRGLEHTWKERVRSSW
jgi:hypothetical protein